METTRKRRRRRHCSSCMRTKRKKMWNVLRQVQRKTGCTTRTINVVAQEVAPLLFEDGQEAKNPNNHSFDDAEMLEQAEAKVLQLHGCVGCDNYVYHPQSTMFFCPKCRHPRFDAEKKPNEVIIRIQI